MSKYLFLFNITFQVQKIGFHPNLFPLLPETQLFASFWWDYSRKTNVSMIKNNITDFVLCIQKAFAVPSVAHTPQDIYLSAGCIVFCFSTQQPVHNMFLILLHSISGVQNMQVFTAVNIVRSPRKIKF